MTAASSSRRPLIGLTVGRDLARDPSYLRLRDTYPRAVERAGGIPVLVPPMDDEAALEQLLERLDGLVFPGGIDVHPSHFGEQPHPTTQVDEVLDRLELYAARWAAERPIPTLGICRGQQLLNVALGGSLIQDLPSEGRDGHRQQGDRADLSHRLRVAPGSRLASICGSLEFQTNTFHHQAIRHLGRGLRAVAWTDDGVVEGIESTEHPWLLAVQFHPEDLAAFHTPSQRLFQALVAACSNGPSPVIPSAAPKSV